MIIRTNVFCITYYTHDKSLYMRFYDCNLNCIYCINRLSPYDTHLPREILTLLESRPIRPLNLENLKRLLSLVYDAFDVKTSVLGGGEPTIDRGLLRIIEFLKRRGTSIRLLTNGILLNVKSLKRVLNEDDVIIISVKALDRERYRRITGTDALDKVLKNIYDAYNAGLNIILEVVFARPLINIGDIIEIAKWISTCLDPNVMLIIDKYVPVPNVDLQRPNDMEVRSAYEGARAYLKNVIIRPSKGNKTIGGYVVYNGVRVAWCWRCIGDIHLIYPPLPLPHKLLYNTLNFE